MGLVLSHQNIEDVPRELQAPAFGNIATIVAFRVGSSYATQLSYHFGAKVEGINFIKTPLYKAYAKIEMDVFTMNTLPPPDIDRGQTDKIIAQSREGLSKQTSVPIYQEEGFVEIIIGRVKMVICFFHLL